MGIVDKLLILGLYQQFTNMFYTTVCVKKIFPFLLAATLLFSCRKTVQEDTRGVSSHQGGTFRIAGNLPVTTVFPLSLSNESESMIALQMHECLTRLDPVTMEVIPGLAESWERSPDGKTITFHLRPHARFCRNACFGDGPGAEITSADVLYTFEQLCSKSVYNYHFGTVMKGRLAGAEEFHAETAKGKHPTLHSFRIIDAHTFSVELAHPTINFLHILANPVASILSEKAVKAYGSACKVGAGPFMYDSLSTEQTMVLVRNPDYYAADSAGCALPYLDTLKLCFYPGIEEALLQFENDAVDLLHTLPSERIRDVVEKNIQAFKSHPPKFYLDLKPEMISQYYTFNTTRAPFDNVKVRRAINYAIDRSRLVNTILMGQAAGEATHGITPDVFPGYDIRQINGYDFDPAKARKLLAEAGYPNGKGFPTVTVLVNSGSSRNSSVVTEIRRQLKEVLNINCDFESLPNASKFELERHGKGDIFRDAWVADYPSPENFLSLFVGDDLPTDPSAPSFPNVSRYHNPVYDALYRKGRDAGSKDSSYAWLLRAEQVLVNDAPLIPLWYESTYRLISTRIKGFQTNPMRYYDLTKVHIH